MSNLGTYIGYKDKEKQRKYEREWRHRHRELQREYQHQVRDKVLTLLGGKCVNCGYDDYAALEINHINGGGSQEHDTWNSNHQFYFAILNGTRSHNDLNLMCKICNSYHCLKVLKHLKGDWKITYISQ